MEGIEDDVYDDDIFEKQQESMLKHITKLFFTRPKKTDIAMPVGRQAVNFRKVLFLPIADSTDLLSNKDWEQLDLRCLELMKKEVLRASCITRGLIKKGGKIELVNRLKESLLEQKDAEFRRREEEEKAYQKHLDMLGGVWSFGSGSSGQLGHGTLDSISQPTLIRSLRGRGIAHVFAGFDADVSFAVSRSGDVYVWGKRLGPTGLPPEASFHELKRLTQLNDSKKIFDTIKLIKNSSSLGDSSQDPEEYGGGEDIIEPVKLFSLCGEGINDIAVGRVHACAKTKDGDVFTWGQNEHCQLGNEPAHNLSNEQNQKARIRYGQDYFQPLLLEKTIPQDTIVKKVASGTNHTFIVTEEHNVIALGAFYATETNSSFSRCLEKLKVLQLSCGAMHAGLVTTSGQAYTWGDGDGGRLGHGDFQSCLVPRLVDTLKDDTISEIACSIWHTAVIVVMPPLIIGGMVYTWGTGRLGQLAQGGKQLSLKPGPVNDLLLTHAFIKKICAGMYHNVAISLDDEVYTWGSNRNGCLGRPNELAGIEEEFCAVPGHVEGLNAFVGRPCSIAAGREYTLIATKPYIGPTQEEITRKEKAIQEAVVIIENATEMELQEQQLQLKRIQQDKIITIIKVLNESYPKCTLCLSGYICPGFQREEMNPGRCQHCKHEIRKHVEKWKLNDSNVTLEYLKSILAQLQIEISYDQIRNIHLEDQLRNDIVLIDKEK